MKKKKKSCSCNKQNNMYNKNVNYTKKQDVCEHKSTCNINPCETNPCECNTKKTECCVKSCIPDKTITPIECCKPTKCKTKIKEYPCPCEEECEIKCEDKCVDLSKRAEELFEKAMKYEKMAMCAFKEARQYEENARCLSQKSCNLLQSAKAADKGSKDANCSAQELIKKAEELCNKAKCLYKEASLVEKEAEENCQNAKCAYEKAENCNEQAKYLYNQALKYEEKALKCYKSAQEKIKEYGGKSKKCEELINKCNMKLNNYMEGEYDKCECKPMKKEMPSCECKPIKKHMTSCDDYKYEDCKGDYSYESCKYDDYCEEEIIQLVPEKKCGCTYINPMYDMTPMQYMGNMSTQYMTMETPYIMPCDEIQNINDMWNNYYMYIQKMIKSMN